MSTITDLPAIDGSTTMAQLLAAYPGAQRALFARYHIGGCKSCGFSPNETLAAVCARNENLPVDEAIAHIQESHSSDASIQITPLELAEKLAAGQAVQLLDARTREEHEAVKLPGAHLLDQAMIQTIFNTFDKATPLVIYDHQGQRSLDAAAYFIGHGFGETKSLAGGIDAYSVQADPSIPRYSLEFED
jgi:rhodanese-related sulfurtransferase